MPTLRTKRSSSITKRSSSTTDTKRQTLRGGVLRHLVTALRQVPKELGKELVKSHVQEAMQYPEITQRKARVAAIAARKKIAEFYGVPITSFAFKRISPLCQKVCVPLAKSKKSKSKPLQCTTVCMTRRSRSRSRQS
jgi:hypothetical protein